jgi:membrane protein YdbS with pleckstrin-like domain
MTIKFSCPKCGATFTVRDELAGQEKSCNQCKSRLRVPSVRPKKGLDAEPDEPDTLKATSYPRMRRSQSTLRVQQKVRAVLDASGFGPSTLGRLCFALILALVPFGISLGLSFAFHASPANAIASAAAILATAFVPVLILVVGPSDAEVEKQIHYITANLPRAKAAWLQHKKQVAADQLEQEHEQEVKPDVVSMSYVDRSLVPGEEVVHYGTLHYSIFLPGAFLLLLGIATLSLGLVADIASVLFYLGCILICTGLLSLLGAFIRKVTTELAVTNQRVIIKAGVLRRRTIEMNLAKIENIQVDQSILGRLFGCGTITVVGTGGTREPFTHIDDPLGFRRAVQSQSH